MKSGGFSVFPLFAPIIPPSSPYIKSTFANGKRSICEVAHARHTKNKLCLHSLNRNIAPGKTNQIKTTLISNTYETSQKHDASPASGAGTYHYVFGYESSSVYGFYNLAAATTVPAGKAYLETTGGNLARALRFSLGGITEVENIEAEPEATVKKNGAYLENGKIAIYKNGMKFNANGQLIK